MASPNPIPPPIADAPRLTRQPRITLVSDYLPQDAARHVHGAFQRLLCHIKALQHIAHVDVIFLWPWGRQTWTEDCRANLAAVRSLWDFRGRTDLVFSSFTGQTSRLRVLIPAMLASGIGRRMAAWDAATMDDIAVVLGETKPDLIFAHRMGAALPVVRRFAGRWPIIVDFDDVEHIRLRREAKRAPSWTARLGNHTGAWLTRRLEREILAAATVALVCSDADAGFLRPLVPGARLTPLPNSSPAREVPAPATTPTALFVGMARYRPNAEGLIWLAREIWPRVRRDLPMARLVLAGFGSDELGIADAAKGIDALGFVPDLVPLYGQARIALCPLRAASGTRIKIIEAAMFGRASVSTIIGAEGLAFRDGREIALQDEPEAFARTCVALLGDPNRAVTMGTAARDMANRLYSQEAMYEQLARICAAATQAGPRADYRAHVRTDQGLP